MATSARTGARSRDQAKAVQRHAGARDWSSWPAYESAARGLRGFWYPVEWSAKVKRHPVGVKLCGVHIALIRDEAGKVHALHDRCAHRGVPLIYGRREWPNTISCSYHGWTYRLEDGELCAVITDGPNSPICGKARVKVYPAAERLNMIWVYFPVDDEEPPSIDETAIPEELRDNTFAMGGVIEERPGNWRFAAENGCDEGHAKYLHNTSLWRLFKTMPAWNETHMVRQGRWLYRIHDKVHWEAEFPGLGKWTNYRWYRNRPPKENFHIGNTGKPRKVDPVIEGLELPGFASITLPGHIRIAFRNSIHYEWYVPLDENRFKFIGVMAQFRTGLSAELYRARYLGAIRWLFHGLFSGQDSWAIDVTNAPPERLYRPDASITAWRKLVEEAVREQGGEHPHESFEELADRGRASVFEDERNRGLRRLLRRRSNTRFYKIDPGTP
jgi:phenylpropionate dioxygenase-like ring-hydroxylating dioxygenase large terminal subunit